MLGIVFSKAALLFYLFIIVTEFTTKYGVQEAGVKGKSRILSLADLCGLCGFIFLIFYSINTVWWAFIALLGAYVVIYRLLKLVIFFRLINKKYIYLISTGSRYILIPLIILMFILVKK
ncbi:MAG: hypothetical protein ABIQ31_18700 [Ferruginibacter sp.]